MQQDYWGIIAIIMTLKLFLVVFSCLPNGIQGALESKPKLREVPPPEGNASKSYFFMFSRMRQFHRQEEPDRRAYLFWLNNVALYFSLVYLNS